MFFVRKDGFTNKAAGKCIKVKHGYAPVDIVQL